LLDATTPAASPLYTGPTPEHLARIPAILKERHQWILWRGEDRLNKKTGKVKLIKIPINPVGLRKASTMDPRTWSSYDVCVQALPVALEAWKHDTTHPYRGGGIGFVFTKDDTFCGLDLDHCIDTDTGVIADWAQEIVVALASYTETSPSLTGLHIIAQGTLPEGRRRKGSIEMYDQGRFFTMTGLAPDGGPLLGEPRQVALEDVHQRRVATPSPARMLTASVMPSPNPEDTALLAKAGRARNGAKFSRLWAGDISGYSSQSEADMALCAILAYWTQDEGQIDRLFRQSSLMRDKWDEQHGERTYGAQTITAALAQQTEHYDPVHYARHTQTIADDAMAAAMAQQTATDLAEHDEDLDDLQDVTECEGLQDAGDDADIGAQQQAAEPAHDLHADVAALLDKITAAPEDEQLQIVLDAMGPTLAKLSNAAWLLFKGKLKTLMKQRVQIGDLDKVRSELIKAQNKAKRAAQQPHQVPMHLELTALGDPKVCLSNVIEILTKDAEWVGLFAFDALRSSPMLMRRPPWRLPSPELWEPREVTDEDCSEANNWLQRVYEFFPNTTLVAEAINTVSRRHSYHEIRDYLNRLTWDGTPRLDTWLMTYCHADDGPYTRAVGRKMLLSAVARVMEPGCKADAMLILIGEQGWLKSFVFRVLASDRWFSDTYIDLRSKDAYQVLKGKWLVEFQEMTTMHDSDINRLKGYVSSQSDNYRDSYGRLSRTHPRQNIFCGTSNREDLFKDETGNRRFLPVKVQARCNIEALQRDRDQLWAEALYYYRRGEQWYLDEEMEKIAAAVQDQFLDTGAWEGKIMNFLKKGRFYRVTADYLLEHAIRAPAFLWTGFHYRAIALIMRKHGWQGPKHIAEEPERWVYQAEAPTTPSKGRTKGYEDPQRRFVDRKSGQHAQREADIYLDLQDIAESDHTHRNIGSTIGSTIDSIETPSKMAVYTTDAPDAPDNRAYLREHLSLFASEEEEVGSGQREENTVYKVSETAGASGVSDHTRINTSGNSAPPRATAPEPPEIGSIEDDRYQRHTPASAPCSHSETDAVAGEVTCTACGEVLSSNAAVIPCAMCGQIDRWDDNSVPRCVTCWPPEKVSPKHKRRPK